MIKSLCVRYAVKNSFIWNGSAIKYLFNMRLKRTCERQHIINNQISGVALADSLFLFVIGTTDVHNGEIDILKILACLHSD